jgi:hypothetical protein
VSRLDRIYSATDQTPPAAPSGITAQALSSQAILVQWLPVTDASGVSYTLERGDGVSFGVIQSGLAVTQYTDSVPRGSHFHYRVKAVDGASNASTYSVDVDVTTPANSAPEWSPGVTGFSVPSNAAIGTVVADLSLYASDADGDALTITQTSGTLPSGLSYSPTTKRITVTGTLSAGATADVTYAADDGYSTAAEDWLLRSTGPGVIWAHRFESSNADGLYWSPQTYSNAAPRRIGYKANEGIIGDGCLEIFVPAGTAVQGYWARPLAPVSAIPSVNGYRAKAADANVAGLPVLNFGAFYASDGDPINRRFNGGGGLFASAYDYANNNRTLANGQSEIIYGGGFYLQFRVKFPTFTDTTAGHVAGDNRLDYPNTTGKLFILGNIEKSNPDHEIVNQLNSNKRHQLYGANGAYFFGNGQANPTTYQPGYYPANAYWTWPKNEWVTVLLHVVPGRQNPAPVGGDWGTWLASIATQFDTRIETWVARAGATSYTKIHDYSAYALYYGSVYNQNSSFNGGTLANQLAKPGFGLFELNVFMNEGDTSAVTYPKDFWVLHDQIICSTLPIACPRV